VHPPFQQQSQQQQGTDANTFSSSAGNGSARDAASITAPSVPVVFPLNAQVSLPDAHACVAWALFSFAHKLVCQSTHTRTHTHTLHTHTHSLTHTLTHSLTHSLTHKYTHTYISEAHRQQAHVVHSRNIS